MSENTLHAMWVPAHDVVVEQPNQLEGVVRTGGHTRIMGQNRYYGTWLLFAIPTPVLVGGVRARAQAALLRFKVSPGSAYVNSVHVYDGEHRIADHNNLGADPGSWKMIAFPIADHTVKWGIQLAVEVSFTDGPGRWVDFAAVGCDFEIGPVKAELQM